MSWWRGRRRADSPSAAQEPAWRKNENRASAFAALLVRAFGLETLRAGAGVVDVAGGSGELALELVTRWAVPCCVVDPRGDAAPKSPPGTGDSSPAASATPPW